MATGTAGQAAILRDARKSALLRGRESFGGLAEFDGRHLTAVIRSVEDSRI